MMKAGSNQSLIEETAENWRISFELFGHWLDLDASHRRELLGALRRERPEVHAQLEALIRAGSLAERRRFMRPSNRVGGDHREYPALANGATVGSYRLTRFLGAGGTGEVWLARRTDGPAKPVALKLLHPHLIRSTARARFVREGQILQTLADAKIPSLLGSGTLPGDRPFLTIEYVDGQRLDDWCDRRRLDVPGRIRLMIQVCEVVANAHANGIVHCDLKPTNILVDRRGTINLLDFGIAQPLTPGRSRDPVTGCVHRPEESALTPEYAAPEQITGSQLTEATDVYALGAILYLLLCGRRPHGSPGTSLASIEKAIRENTPARPSVAALTALPATESGGSLDDVRSRAALRSTLPMQLSRTLKGDLDRISTKSLRKTPSERYPSALSLREALCGYLERNHLPIGSSRCRDRIDTGRRRKHKR